MAIYCYLFYFTYKHKLFILLNPCSPMHQIVAMTGGVLKNISELPPHISFDEYNKLLAAVDKYFEGLKPTKKRDFFRARDKLFLFLLWETGGRVGDICNLRVGDFDFNRRVLNLRVKKTKKTTTVTLDDRACFEVSEYLRNYHVEDALFDLTPQRAWQLVKRYAKEAGIEDVHPHKFRHGLAIYLLSQNVPIPVISARLGHSSVYITMQLYMKITAEIQRRFLENIPMRSD